VAWIYLAFRGQGSRIAPLAALFAIYMWALSVALGWHYAIDGLVGAAGAVACQWVCKAWIGRRQAVHLVGQPATELSPL
jgi:hypothetical protein